jgi:hypothetical protein
MLELEAHLGDLPQVQNPDGGDQRPPLPQTTEVALSKVRRHPNAEAPEGLRQSAAGPSPRV